MQPQPTNESRCLLASRCNLAATDVCRNTCPSFVAMHGVSGKGGRVNAASAPTDYRLHLTATSPARADQATAYKLIDAYVATFMRQFDDAAPPIKSLYLWSVSPGTGKTTTAAAVLNEYLATHYVGSVKRNLTPKQTPAYFLDVNEWQSLFNEFNRSNVPRDIAEPASREYYRRLTNAKQAPLAVLDDIGVRNATEAFRGDLHGLINHRVANGLPTVYTSNLPLDDMARVFDARLYDRMRDQCVQIHFEGESKRGRR